jgi:hypothetical protein
LDFRRFHDTGLRHNGLMNGVTNTQNRVSRSTWEYRELSFPRGTTTQQARAALTEAAEYDHWELARVRIFRNGGRRVWLRRKTYAVTRTA